jgi:O-6-methylguanine DNA methyltransferase
MTARVLATAVAAPWWFVHVAATERGVAAIELTTTREAFLADLARRFRGPAEWHATADAAGSETSQGAAADAGRHLAAGTAAVAAALAGDDGDLLALPLDLDDRPAWDRAVLGAVRTIPRGSTRSYGEIARQVGTPGAARAVGGAVGRNPVALAIPCHRVIAGDGTLGGYGGGWWGDRERLLELKASLLAAEGLDVRRRPSGPGGGR